LLPGAFYCLKETKVPPITVLRARQIPMAIATDCNPGSSPMTSLLLAMNMASTLFGLTTEECIAGVTRNAARALGRHSRIGTLDVGHFCDLAIWDVNDLSELVHGMGFNPLHSRVWRGK
ncbi:MAG: amidohydrolase family protein, partial [Rhodospirillaceae bacterium]|nr:amidohydrolase family protein [Rhodospirillaceae bacterium]